MSRYLDIANEVLRELGQRHCDKSDGSDQMSGTGDGRWDADYAAKGYVWCLDCRHWGSTACGHPDNPFRRQQPLAPRKCQWFEALGAPAGSRNG